MKEFEESQIRNDIPEFRSGDLIAVHYNILEGDKRRNQVFEGTVIGLRGGGVRRTFTVRKVSYGIGIERVFPINSPLINKVEVKRPGKVRQSKIYYMRGLSKKASRIKERVKGG